MIGYKLPWGRFNLGIQNLFNTDYQTIWSKRSQILYGAYGVPDRSIIKAGAEHLIFHIPLISNINGVYRLI